MDARQMILRHSILTLNCGEIREPDQVMEVLKTSYEEAKRLLLSTSMSVSEIASYVGYYNISYFSTVFHKIVGVSPFDWRNRKGESGDEMA